MAKQHVFYVATILSLVCLITAIAGTYWAVIQSKSVLGVTFKYSVSLYKNQLATATSDDPGAFSVQWTRNLCDDNSGVDQTCCDQSKQVITCMAVAVGIQFVSLVMFLVKRKDSGAKLLGIFTAMSIFSGIVLPGISLYMFRNSGCYIVDSATKPENYFGVGAWMAFIAVVINLLHNLLVVIASYEGSEYHSLD